MRRAILITIGIVIAGAVGITVWFLRMHTSFLSFDQSSNSIERNNQNPAVNQPTNGSSGSIADIQQLVPHTLTVPANFATGVFAESRTLNLPAGWSASVWVAGLQGPRFFTILDNDSLVVADKDAGRLILIPDQDRNGIADAQIVIDRNLQNVHSVVSFEGHLFVGEEHQVVVYRKLQADGTFDAKEVIVPNLPTGGHATRTVLIGSNRKLYVSIGSSCNVCEEDDERRAAVMEYDLDGKNGKLFAEGLRNSVGITWRGNALWGVDMGRDLIGDDIPPEEVNIIERGKHYGWPYCYGNQIANPEYSKRTSFCKNSTVAPRHEIQAHSAPLGMAFVPSNTLGPLAEHLLVAFHGSWNRTEKTGYKVVWIDPEQPGSKAINLITGWLTDGGNVWGRPVGLGFDSKGTLYISDDQAGAMYRVVSGSGAD